MFFLAIPIFYSLFASAAAVFPFSPLEKTLWIKIKGSFVCNKTDDYKVRVELCERDSREFGEVDDYISTTEVMGEDKFSIEGSASDDGFVELYLRIIHHCYDPREELDGCAHVYLMDVPNGAIANQPDSPQFEMETIDLTDQLEYKDCDIRYLPDVAQQKKTTTSRPQRITQKLTTVTTSPVPQETDSATTLLPTTAEESTKTTPPLDVTEKIDTTTTKELATTTTAALPTALKSLTNTVTENDRHYLDVTWVYPDYY